MKIMLANVGVSPKDGPFVTKMMAPVWKKNFDLVRRPDTEIILRVSQWGIVGMEGFFNHAIDTLNSQLIFKACQTAEADGFDAVLITCFGDPMLEHVRSFVNIPVMSIGEAAMRTAAMMGKKFGIVHVSQKNIYECRKQIEEYGLKDYLAGIVATTETSKEQADALIDAHGAVKAFTEAGRKLIGMGAEVLIPACGLMSPSLRIAPGCEDEYPNGFTAVDGVPIVDVLSVGLKYAEMMADLKKAGSPWISRSGFYALPTEAEISSGAMVLEDERQTFWDISLTNE